MKTSAKSPRRKVLKQRTAKAGLPPGSLVYVGEDKPPHATRISIIDYDEHGVRERDITRVEECLQFKDTASVTWINVDEIHEPGLIETFGRVLGFHALMLEDILNTDQRPKIEDHGGYLYVVLKMLEWNAERGEIDIEQLSLVVGPNYVISFQERAGDFFDPLRARIREAVGRARKLGADFLAYSLLDLIIDHYFIVLDRLGERIEQVRGRGDVAAAAGDAAADPRPEARADLRAQGGVADEGGHREPAAPGHAADREIHGRVPARPAGPHRAGDRRRRDVPEPRLRLARHLPLDRSAIAPTR